MDGETATLKATEARAEPAPAAPSPKTAKPDAGGESAKTETTKEPKRSVHELFGETWWPRDARRRNC